MIENCLLSMYYCTLFFLLFCYTLAKKSLFISARRSTPCFTVDTLGEGGTAGDGGSTGFGAMGGLGTTCTGGGDSFTGSGAAKSSSRDG